MNIYSAFTFKANKSDGYSSSHNQEITFFLGVVIAASRGGVGGAASKSMTTGTLDFFLRRLRLGAAASLRAAELSATSRVSRGGGGVAGGRGTA